MHVIDYGRKAFKEDDPNLAKIVDKIDKYKRSMHASFTGKIKRKSRPPHQRIQKIAGRIEKEQLCPRIANTRW
jgi:hypothetical protein